MPILPSIFPKKRSIAETVVLGTVFGFAAGAVGTLLVAVYLLPQPSLSGTFLPIQRGAGETLPGREASMSVDSTSVGRAAVLLFAADPAPISGAAPAELVAPDVLRRTYLPGDAIASGIILTSDGWILSYGDAAAKAAGKKTSRLTAVIGGRSYAVDEAITDPFTGVVFLKVKGSNLQVTSFGDGPDLMPGDPVYAYDAAGGLRRLDVIGLDDQPPKTAEELLRSSERTQKILRLADGADVPVGSMVLNTKGELVGLFMGRAAIGSVAMPLGTVSGQIGAVLRGKSTVRPLLGVRYVDLSRLIGGSSAVRRGALLSPSLDGKIPAVAKRSPAEASGLRSGDIITAVNDEEVTANRALSDLIAEYEPGSSVSLTVHRRGTVRTVTAVLGTSR